MPALVTHDQFGRDILNQLPQIISGDTDEREAFLLGNQGPDPLFYVKATTKRGPEKHLAHLMHAEHPSALIQAFHEGLEIFEEDERGVARAYALGFLCHYTLDRTAHPLIYRNQFDLCDAGVEGLTRKDGSTVHGAIESEIDEMVLWTKQGRTIAQYHLPSEVLRGSERMLHIVDKLYTFVALRVYGMLISPGSFSASVKAFRFVQAMIYSPSGISRALIGAVEERFRRYSLMRALSMRPIERTDTPFANEEHRAWEQPFTHEIKHESFWDLYMFALEDAKQNIVAFVKSSFNAEDAAKLTHGMNFEGEPAEASLTICS